MKPRSLVLCGVVAGCGGGPEPLTQAERWQRALTEGPELCAGLDDPMAQGSCVTASAPTLARTDLEAALRACTAASTPWLEECMFRVADAALITGDDAARVCPLSGRYAGQCLGHAASREADLLFATPGQEPEGLARLRARVDVYRKGRRAEEEARGLAARAIARRSPEQPFAAALCGRAPVDLCVYAYTQRSILSAPAEALCAGSAPWPEVAEDAQSLAAEARASLCSPKPAAAGAGSAAPRPQPR